MENKIAFKKYSFEKEINNPKISMFPITLKCVAERFNNVWEFELTNSEINYLTTHESGLIFTSEKYLIDYVYEGFQSYEYDLEQHYSTQSKTINFIQTIK